MWFWRFFIWVARAIFQLFGDCHHYWWQCCKFTPMLSAYGFYQSGFFYVQHLLRHRTSVFKVISEKPVILTTECHALGEGAITTYFKRLRLTRPAWAGLELTTPRLLSERTITRLRQPINRLYSYMTEFNEKLLHEKKPWDSTSI
jgi:hypothetical protein